MYPPIQVVNKDDKPVRGATLKEIHKQGLVHRVVYVVVEDTNGRILLQKRGPSMATYANCWDVSAAGHVDEGKTYEAAAKTELKEELGLTGFPLRKIKKFYNEATTNGRQLNYFCQVYKVVVPVGVTLRPDIKEVADISWLTPPQLKKFMSEHTHDIALGLLCLIKHDALSL